MTIFAQVSTLVKLVKLKQKQSVQGKLFSLRYWSVQQSQQRK